VDNGKIFGIGFPKTATSSLSKALTLLDYRSVHDPYDILPRFFPEELKDFRYDPGILENNDALAGVVCLVFRELDQAYPGSRFILTVRDEENWLASLRGHLYPRARATRMDAELPLQPFVRSSMFHGDLWFIEAHAGDYLAAYRRFNQDVCDYFKGRDDLLIMNIEAGDGWEKLCGFLGRDIPPEAFPWKNRRSLRRSLRRIIKYWRRKLGLGRIS
jgi:hypothetical protein